ncbi:hypothetical protein AVENLUH5627_02112 [Acinetobacter venetianus]|uniref:Uncharacterized protein n=1 Tax=Acinetobacter venetianus TaxID=52133 RepID=A0A150HMP7_9GAMM|nr:hypothetical protein [Acinetobacter venetianus]KXZ67323.1 hypothetical protein AVENLUH5627_02208 [Acinetobacter venetianus]KXZ67542.1 hypothetical protein AVENLUH5627_02119 [Acinetobacter venetianus]KXZ67571.1 hypothetical protein AVENLUH5627_02100 [Acinetobacter venetianus]KXZ67583.1 hypothetical protein AVENLUH5627_02112 [Acinetobacter venetianus]
MSNLEFWLGFIIGGVVCVSVVELIQFIIISSSGIKEYTKELKRKNDIEERKEPKL